MQTTLKIIADDPNGNEITKSVTYANPQASNVILKQAAQKLNTLTNNTLKKIVRVDTTDITDAE